MAKQQKRNSTLGGSTEQKEDHTAIPFPKLTIGQLHSSKSTHHPPNQYEKYEKYDRAMRNPHTPFPHFPFF
jgi:hypothetical protein